MRVARWLVFVACRLLRVCFLCGVRVLVVVVCWLGGCWGLSQVACWRPVCVCVCCACCVLCVVPWLVVVVSSVLRVGWSAMVPGCCRFVCVCCVVTGVW